MSAFTHHWQPGDRSLPTLLLLHGTGGDEQDLLPLGEVLLPDAAILSPRGQVLEHGMPRFFRRLSEGVFDEADLIARTNELADWIADAAQAYRFDPARVVAVGFSNGANIAASMLLLRPKVLAGAVLFRAMFPIEPTRQPDLRHARVLIAGGMVDTMAPRESVDRLEQTLLEAGAQVTSAWQMAGHGLTPSDARTAQAWLQEQIDAGTWAPEQPIAAE